MHSSRPSPLNERLSWGRNPKVRADIWEPVFISCSAVWPWRSYFGLRLEKYWPFCFWTNKAFKNTPYQRCCFLQAWRRCLSPQDRACQSTLLWIVRVASVLKAVFALAVNDTISVGRHRLITVRSHLHAQHWNPGRRPGFYKIPLPASLLFLCTQLVDLLSQLLDLFEGLQVPKL